MEEPRDKMQHEFATRKLLFNTVHYIAVPQARERDYAGLPHRGRAALGGLYVDMWVFAGVLVRRRGPAVETAPEDGSRATTSACVDAERSRAEQSM